MPRRRAYGIELLADPTRRAIVALLAIGVHRPAQIAAAIRLSRPATSRQLKLLAEAGLIRWTWSRLDRRGRFYAIHPSMAGPITAWLTGVEVKRTPQWRDDGWSGPRWPPDEVMAAGESTLADGGSV